MKAGAELLSIASNFQVQARPLECRPYCHGHIHHTYLVIFDTGHYILQQINSSIFHDPIAVMENISRVTAHIRNKLVAQGCKDILRRVLQVIPSVDGKGYYIDTDGLFWRMFPFIDRTITVDVPRDCSQIYQGAKAFGQFDAMLLDLPGPPLHRTIESFHDGPTRLQQLQRVLDADPCNRAASARPEIEFVLNHAQTLLEPASLVSQDRLNVHITHNDTKINNILLDEITGEGICVIDLDTVMDGIWLYDLGDIIRTTSSRAPEDEQDIEKVHVCLDRYMAAVAGFIEGTEGMIGQDQLRYIPLAGRFMTLIMATRFLADFLQGDRYFKVSRPNHNLDRSRCQIRLMQSMIENEQKIMQLIESISQSGSGPK